MSRALELSFRSEATVLILGPTGSGKTRLAREIHENSSRKGRNFTTVNLAAIHEGTIESELFGHERGAYTGADQKRVGRLEASQGGTVFLDEIGELSPRLQARLLEFLQSRTICPVGSGREIKLDVRVIAATHRDLSSSVRSGEFREDLFHRLRVLAIDLKPLRERNENFGVLVHRCLEEVCRQQGRAVLRLSEEFADQLERYSWPGNFRELRNVLEYAVISSTGESLGLNDLPEWFQTSLPQMTSDQNPLERLQLAEIYMGYDYQKTMNEFEKDYLRRRLAENGGRLNQTARMIGLNKTTFLRKVRAHQLILEPKTATFAS